MIKKPADSGKSLPAYRVVYSGRKTLAICITENAELVVRAPYFTPASRIHGILSGRMDWIEKSLARMRLRALSRKTAETDPHLAERETRLRQDASVALKDRAEALAGIVGVGISRVRISGARKRWGSCSAEGNISLSWRLMLLPRELSDYVIVHELCHRLEMNHSKAFWREVERVMPDYKSRRRALREWHEKLLLEGW